MTVSLAAGLLFYLQPPLGGQVGKEGVDGLPPKVSFIDLKFISHPGA